MADERDFPLSEVQANENSSLPDSSPPAAVASPSPSRAPGFNPIHKGNEKQ